MCIICPPLWLPPNGKVIGLSKIPRIVEIFARRLQLQDRMTRQIAGFIRDLLNPQDVAVVVESLHMCNDARYQKTKCAHDHLSDAWCI